MIQRESSILTKFFIGSHVRAFEYRHRKNVPKKHELKAAVGRRCEIERFRNWENTVEGYDVIETKSQTLILTKH